MTPHLSPRFIPVLATAVVAVALYAAGAALYPGFASLRVLVNLFGDNAFLGIAAVGATFVILSGGIDLSTGAMVALTSTLIARLLAPADLPAGTALGGYLHDAHPALAIGAALALGGGLGAAQGALIHCYRLPPFLVTLAGMFFCRGLAFCLHPQSLSIKHPFYLQTVAVDLALPLPGGLTLPPAAVCFVAVLVAGIVLAQWTRFGRCVYAVGDAATSAALMGLPVGRTRILVYLLAGGASALAGVVYTCYTQAGDPAACVGFELDAIAAVVIGGTLLSGGVGFVGGTALGVLILGLIQTLITFHGALNSWWTRIAIGLLLLVFIGLQNLVVAVARRRPA